MSRGWREQAIMVAVLVSVAGIGLLAYGAGPGLLFVGAIALAGLLLERTYRAPSMRPPVGPNWRATDERFTDPETGQPTRVWYDPSTGERHYVADDSKTI